MPQLRAGERSASASQDRALPPARRLDAREPPATQPLTPSRSRLLARVRSKGRPGLDYCAARSCRVRDEGAACTAVSSVSSDGGGVR